MQAGRDAPDAARKLWDYCRSRNWAGIDPYDALNSRLFRATPLARSRWARIVFTQVLKRLPVDIRPLLLIDEAQNAKAMAVILRAAIVLERTGTVACAGAIEELIDHIERLRSPGECHWCWGYSFPWQTRTVLVPRGAPNLVSTCFVADALLEAYESGKGDELLAWAASSADYLTDVLFWSDDDGRAGFSYPVPSLRSMVHNANFLGAALLARVYRHTGERKYLERALAVARWSAGRQRDDGAWLYGENPSQHWIDNFHTGYNLCALRAIERDIGVGQFARHLDKGYEFYRHNFFRGDGAPKYFDDQTYPIDAHCVAQSIITLITLRELSESSVDEALSVFRWARVNMWSEKGYFEYQVRRLYKNRIPYMRWSQAWMLLALATLCEAGAQFSSTDGHADTEDKGVGDEAGRSEA